VCEDSSHGQSTEQSSDWRSSEVAVERVPSSRVRLTEAVRRGVVREPLIDDLAVALEEVDVLERVEIDVTSPVMARCSRHRGVLHDGLRWLHSSTNEFDMLQTDEAALVEASSALVHARYHRASKQYTYQSSIDLAGDVLVRSVPLVGPYLGLLGVVARGTHDRQRDLLALVRDQPPSHAHV